MASLWISPWIQCVVHERESTTVGYPVQTHETLLGYASMITKQKKCREKLTQKFEAFQISCNSIQQLTATRNNIQQSVQTPATCWAQHCCERLHGTKFVTRVNKSSMYKLLYLSDLRDLAIFRMHMACVAKLFPEHCFITAKKKTMSQD